MGWSQGGGRVVLVELGVVEQRYRAVLEVLDEGASVTDVDRRYGVARQTVHEWLRRYANDGGLGGLADRSSRPERCPHQMPPAIEARVLWIRRAHPSWGPSRIVWQLEQQGVVPLPGRSSVYRALVRHGLVEAKKRKRRREDYRRWERSRAMELWQMDVMGRVHLADGQEVKIVTCGVPKLGHTSWPGLLRGTLVFVDEAPSRTVDAGTASAGGMGSSAGSRAGPAGMRWWCPRCATAISGLVPAGGDVGGAEAEREFHHPGPVVDAGFEVAGRGGHAERGQLVVQAGDGAQAGGRRAVLPWFTAHLARGGAGGGDLGGEDDHGVQDVGVDDPAG
jgi:transposase